MEKLKIQSGRKESILTLDQSARHPDSNGVNGTPIRVQIMRLWQKEGWSSLQAFDVGLFIHTTWTMLGTLGSIFIIIGSPHVC